MSGNPWAFERWRQARIPWTVPRSRPSLGLAGNVYCLVPVNLEERGVLQERPRQERPGGPLRQINKSSTGDVLWDVRHVVTVDDHIRFERRAKDLCSASCCATR